MAKPGQRISNKKRAEVVSEILNEPNVTQREVAARTNISAASVNRIQNTEMKHLQRQDNIAEIIENDVALLKVGQQQVFNKISKGEATVGEMVKSNSDSTRRYQLLTGGATHNINVKQESYADKEIEAIVIEAEAKIRRKHEASNDVSQTTGRNE